MKKTKQLFRIVYLAVILLAVFASTALAQLPQPEPLPALFSGSDRVEPRAGEPPSPEVIRSRAVEVDFSILQELARTGIRGDGPAFNLNLFEDASFATIITSIEEMSSGSLGMTGVVEGAGYSEVVMVARGDALQAVIQVDSRVFEVRYNANGHMIVEVDQSGYPPSAPPLVPEHQAALESQDIAPPVAADSGAVIDVLVVYTPSARSLVGGTDAMEDKINLSILSANNGYAESGVVQRLNLVGMREVSYTETISGATNADMWNYALYRLTFGYYGSDPTSANYLADARSYREQYGADLVMMIANLPATYCGIAWVGGEPSEAYLGYSVVHPNCAGNSAYTPQHEMGHNMGACHDWGNTSDTIKPYCWDNYSFGYQQLASNFYTVMSYAPNPQYYPGFVRINRWSNPNQTYNSYLTGIPFNGTYATYNALTLNNTAYYVANYRQSMGINASFSQPEAGGQVLIPRAYLTVNATSTEGSITSVVFRANYNGAWHTLGTDNSGSDGWQILWSTAGISQQTISLEAVVSDSSSNQITITRSNILLSPTQLNAGGFESRESGGTPAEEAVAPLAAAEPAPQAEALAALPGAQKELRETLYHRSPGAMRIKPR